MCKPLTLRVPGATRWNKTDLGALNDKLAGMFEIYRDPIADHRLHLPNAPLWLEWMAHETPGFDEFVHTSRSPSRSKSMTVQDQLAQLVCARLCHDLISPLGAVRNGLELSAMAPGKPATGEMDLISDSLESALAKLRYYRLAFGPADPESQQRVSEARQVTDAMFGGRFGVSWELPREDLSRPLAQVVYLALLCIEKSLPLGGKVTILGVESGLTLGIEARRMSPSQELWGHVMTGESVPNPRADAVQFLCLRTACEKMNLELGTAFDETGGSVGIRLGSPEYAQSPL